MKPRLIATLGESGWQPTASGEALLQLSATPAGRTGALQMDYDFKGAGGFVVARQPCRHALPPEYRIRFRLRGSGSVNDLEIKLVDASGLNVWRHVIKALVPPARWRSFCIDDHEMSFGWGPAGGERLSELGAVEFALVAAGEGGAGRLLIGDVRIEDATPPSPRVSASSATPGHLASQALRPAGWKPKDSDTAPWLALDLLRQRRLGGLIIDWAAGAPDGGFVLRQSNDGRQWSEAWRAPRAAGPRSYVYLPGFVARHLRLELQEPTAGLRLSLEPFDFSRSLDAFWHGIAQREPRGMLPRWLVREQSLWTPSGIPDGTHCALMNEDGLVEPAPGSFTLEPFLKVAGKLHGWAEVQAEPALRDGWQPVPSVSWSGEGWRLRIECDSLRDGTPRLRYALANTGRQPLAARLFVVLRPFQVTPPWQSFRQMGGVSRIQSLELRGSRVLVNGGASLESSRPPAFGALGFDEGLIVASLARDALPPRTKVEDAFGFASGALAFDLEVGTDETQAVEISCLAAGAEPASATPAAAPDAVAVDWASWLPVTQWSAAGWGAQAVQASLTAAAHVLVTRDGPALQPGARRYTRSWIRDGAMMSAALLRLGCREPVAEFIRWYAPFQRTDGFVPCCVDRQGPDWLVEHDSHAQLIALIADHHAFSGADALLTAHWEHIEKAVACIERLLDDTGLLPLSASHEGYLAQPVHAFWDDFWALRGLGDAAYLARRQGLDRQAQRWERLRTRLAAALWRAIEDTCARRGLSYQPGSIEWADFDPTATANALTLLDVPAGLDRARLERTFDQYLADWRAKRSGAIPSANYTPYEIRIIGALVRLGRRADALELLRFFLDDRRPRAWNQWPEIAWRDVRAPAHVGDVPHTWIAAEYVLALRSLIAYEREQDRTLFIGAGLSGDWLDGEGVRVESMPTLYGPLSYRLRCRDPRTLVMELVQAPAARLVLVPPVSGRLERVLIDGEPAIFADAQVEMPARCCEVICTANAG
ncbi:MAG: discoidin domain-containing protein [Steroidobacteraceae bacterium]